MDLLEVVKMFLQYAVAPLAAFFVWTYKKHHTRVDQLEKRLSQVEKSTAIIQVMVDHIKDDIREIKQGINKLIDRG